VSTGNISSGDDPGRGVCDIESIMDSEPENAPIRAACTSYFGIALPSQSGSGTD